MNLSKINSIYPALNQFASKHVFKQKQHSINPFCETHSNLQKNIKETSDLCIKKGYTKNQIEKAINEIKSKSTCPITL